MSAVIATASVVPVLAEADPRAAQQSQLVCGESGVVLDRLGPWVRLRAAEDGSEGWVHEGYLRRLPAGEAEGWRSRAAWCEGAVVMIATTRYWLPLRARLALADGEVELPDGRVGRVLAGQVRPAARAQADARRTPPDEWARMAFAGAPYQWGGVTPNGVDCSGLVHTTWLARGVRLPRQAARQAEAGEPVDFSVMRAGDLLCFRGAEGDEIAHVAIAGPDSTLVHASIAAGGVTVEPWLPGTRAADLMRRLVTIRRLDGLESAHAG